MSSVYICDNCKKRVDDYFDRVHFSGNEALKDTHFCQQCFKDIENYVLTNKIKKGSAADEQK